MKKFLIGVLILTISLGVISCSNPTGNDDNPEEEQKIVAEKYRGRFENVAFSGNWYVITEKQIETWSMGKLSAWTVGTNLYQDDSLLGTFTDENTLITIHDTTFKRVPQ